jgi:FlaA1/EpsC-like NDP-sugar epimerase/lipopolysaccharide/colanic/teichoic acid biosynthesis glycosyltransferase
MKRTFDLVVSSTTLVLLAPLLAVVAVLIWIDSGRPILFRQWRIGRGLVPFQIYKFRTMHAGAERDGALTAAGDPRVTRLGVWLRLTKLDELPQLINVLKGEMSLVGPRPEVEKYVRLFADEYREVLRVRPGITDLASLKYRHEAELLATAVDREEAYVSRILPDKLRLAKAYVSRASFWYDLTLIGRTLWSLPPLPDLRPPAAGLSTFGESKVGSLLLRYRRALVVGVHLALIVITNYCAFWLRFDGSIPAESFALFVQFLPALVLVRGLTFVPFRLYEGLWRYTGIGDLRNIVGGVLTSSTIFFILVYVALGNAKYPRSIYLIDAMLLITSMGGVRLSRRLYAELVRSPRERRVLVYGAGDAGEMVVRDMLRHPSSDYEPIGFIDDDLSKVGRRIHGVPVLGSRRDLTRIIATKRPSEILVALPGVSRASVRSVVSALESFKIPITTVPNLTDILNGRVTVQQIRHLQIEDLLERSPVGLDIEPLKALVCGRSVLVTGAGGSIGSELCRQIAALQPSLLLMFERYENSLYAIANAINDHHPQVAALPLVGDITDADRVGTVFGAYRPSLVFHAAAHKHVPLMELNPCEAVKNNVLGTRVIAEAAVTHGVERLVLISSDKAVNPSSVMGATKRVAELISRGLNDERVTRCITVRFGNVLGSNGSVVPRFLEQIKAGGPVTVTHREIRRYFMLIPEAVQLVLHAAAIDESGGIYVLEMGDQIKLVDLARNLIRLSGRVPDEEIPIAFTGLRPGEKLAEELVCDDEMVRPSGVPNILQVTPRLEASRQTVAGSVMRLERLAFESNEVELVEELARLVPSFRPDPSVRRLRPAGEREQSTAAFNDTARPLVERRNALGADRRQVRRGGRRREDREEPAVEQTASTGGPVTVQP